MGSGEIPNELGDSWFSPKSLLGGASESRILEVEHCLDEGPRHGLPNSDKLRMPMIYVRESDDE